MDAVNPTSPVRALRDAFGDPKPPAISRKITACVACRKQKIKCHMRDSRPPCTRCKTRGLSCTVNRSLQMLLESDAGWKHSMESKIYKLENLVGKIANVLPRDVLRQLDLPQNIGSTSGVQEAAGVNNNRQEPSSQTESPASHCEIVVDLDSGPGTIPGFSLSQEGVTRFQKGRSHDIISRGVITLENARRYFEHYQNRLDHFPYRILGDHSGGTLDSIRQTSPLLTAAVCTVGALHLATEDFDRLYDEFASLSAAHSFSRAPTVDDVRALCIGAFWLSDLSWTLAGSAVRMATELQLHRSFPRALQGDRAHYLRARLYLLVYACDHHFSVAFGRPPMTRECEAVRGARRLLECRHATEDDARLVSQVLRWSACSGIFDRFGADADRPVADEEVPDLRRFGIALDSLRAEWAERFAPNAHVGNYPRKGVGLQYHFAKLYLCSHAFRGAGPASLRRPSRSQDAAMELEEIANAAVLAALSIVRTVVSDTEIQSFLDGLPTYFDVMIAFSAVFLLKVSTRFSASVRLDLTEIKRLMGELVATLRRVTARMHPRHLLVSITKGIEALLQCCGMAEQTVSEETSMSPDTRPEEVPRDSHTLDSDFSWVPDQNFDPEFMGMYDLLLSQDMDFNMSFALDDEPTADIR
ncbi:Transcription factor [Pleurostoma richardsiae]|uniref:Transcription factor n=1 Tax=Pleurostoma richardsiae TaxID=41990 RepID=A0AA38RMT7_9PEZI|nr:Transcription factor [Pleurostoma richardsiae]